MTKDLYCQFILVILLLLVVGARIFFIHKRSILCWLNNHKKKKWKMQKKQKKLNDFCKMCKTLDKDWDKHFGLEKYISARNAVVKYVDNDKDKLHQLKSEAISENYAESASIIIAEAAMLATVLSIFLSTFGWTNDKIVGKYGQGVLDITINQGIDWYGVLIAFLLAWFVVTGLKRIIDGKCISRWRGYIMTAIEELEKEMNENEKTKISRHVKCCK